MNQQINGKKLIIMYYGVTLTRGETAVFGGFR